MRSAVALALLLVLALLPACLVPSAEAQASGVTYNLYLRCPSDPQTFTIDVPPRVEVGCPIRAVDGGDLMGDPSLAVDPLRPENLIIGSLHGFNDPNRGPDSKSRSGQVFTTFTSQNSGANWVDNPYVPPDDVGSGAYGQHPQVTIDPYGHVFVGSLYAIPLDQNESVFQYVIGAQKFENIDTINEEQSASDGGYHVDYVLPYENQSRIHQMWFTFNPATDNMTMVWFESPPGPRVDLPPPCDDEGATVTAGGYYVVWRVSTPPQISIYFPEMWQESNGLPGLQTDRSCPENPDTWTISADSLAELRSRLGIPPTAAPKASVPSATASTATPVATAVPITSSPTPLPTGSLGLGATAPTLTVQASSAPAPASVVTSAPATTVPAAKAEAPASTDAADLAAITAWMRAHPAPAPRATAAPGNETGNGTANETAKAPGVIGLVWTTADTDTPYYRWNETRVIGPCSASTNPVLSFGLMYVGCVSDPARGEFRWNPDTVPGTVELFRFHPDGGEPEYMGPAPEMPGVPKLGVRSDGRLALVAAGAEEGRLAFKAAFGRYEPAQQAIDWTKETTMGRAIISESPEFTVVAGAIQDVIYREQSGALHVILKTTIDYTDVAAAPASLALPPPHIRKDIIAIDEEYGFLARLELDIGDPTVRNQDGSIAGASEHAFQDISDDFLQLPPGPYTYNGKDLGPEYQPEFFAIADYGTVLFAELIEDTDLRVAGFPPPPAPPAPVASPSSTSLLAPVVGTSFAGLLAATMAAHRRKNPLAAFTKGE